MIVYKATKTGFREDVRLNRIETVIHAAFQQRFGHRTSKSEIESWKNSMMYMSLLLEDTDIPDDSGVAIEYRIPQTSNRIDFILTGHGDDGNAAAIIIELKQWSSASPTDKDGIVRTFLAGSEREVNHPSYQAWSYAALLEDFNEAVQDSSIALNPCAYLHNMSIDTAIRDPRYSSHLDRAPTFIRNESDKLADFIKRFIRRGDQGKLLYTIEHGRIRPSKNLADQLSSMLDGNDEFVMIDDQKLVFETAMNLALRATPSEKHVLIVEGGPGTGKSVVAINLLVRLIDLQMNTRYVTRNAAPRAVYESVLSGSMKKSRISNLFSSSGSYVDCDADVFDTLIIDEAHRLNEKSGFYRNQGDHQIKELIQAAKCSVFFLDEDQRVTWLDVGTADEIETHARNAGASVHRLELLSQFRCNGSNGYLSWLDNALQIRETANEDIGDLDYDIQVLDSPNELMQRIARLNSERNKARTVAGYCWDWITKKRDPGGYDIVFQEHGFRKRWNLEKDGSLWIHVPGSVNEIGCIHTCQGLEVDYIGVIIGPDLIVRNGEVIIQPDKRSRMDQSIKGYKKALKADPDSAQARAELIIKNTYRTLMSRGQKGCYLYCTDTETAEYFRRTIGVSGTVQLAQPETAGLTVSESMFLGLGLRVLPPEEIEPYVNCLPVYDLEIAAGGFEASSTEDCAWVELPDVFRTQPGLFIAKVVGDSMNRHIPNGAWCLFHRNPGGSRNGKIVIVQHRDIQDPETGGSFTIKRYWSNHEVGDSSKNRRRIVLSPESSEDHYEDIVIESDQTESLNVVGSFIAIIG